jgi:hypothetical protein
MRLFSYVVARDYGFAPNPFNSCCTLACCKPDIRRVAQIGDWIVGTGSHTNNRGDRIVFAMRVSDAMTFDQYWSDARFRAKRPFLRGSKKQAFGDNIYHRDGHGNWLQVNSHHSLEDGSPNPSNIEHDTQTDRVLIGIDYIYWGGDGPQIPAGLCDRLCKRGPSHKSNFSDEFIAEVIGWLRSTSETGYSGRPFDWRRSA